MNKLKILVIFLTLITFKIHSQEMTCEDFKSGTFIIPISENMPLPYIITREDNKQIEILEDPNDILSPDFQKEQFVIIEWIDECNYISKYDESKMDMTEFHKLVNDNGGVLNKLIKIEDNCFYLKSSLTINGKTEYLDIVMCKK
tara:strand:+ start:88 stop:519 length:432 start_codon:yes stop_codon:yes gene_type:complete